MCARWKCSRWCCLLVGVTLALGGCETSVDAFGTTDRYYSVFGFLHASADTSWVRIEPLQDSLLTRTVLIDADITIENRTTGSQHVLRDPLFQIPPGGVFAHNFWATMSVNPGHTYRLRIRRSDGAVTTATTTVPETSPTPTVARPPRLTPGCGWVQDQPPTIVQAPGIHRLVAAKVIYRYADRSPEIVSHLADTTRTADGYTITVEWDEDTDTCLVGVVTFDVLLAAGSTDWPDYAILESDTGGSLAQTTNVEHGVGYFGSVTSDTIRVPIERMVASTSELRSPANQRKFKGRRGARAKNY